MINIPINDTYKTIKQIGRDSISTGKQMIKSIIPVNKQGKKSRRRFVRAPLRFVSAPLLRELKYKDVTITNVYPDLSGSYTLVNAIQGGTDSDQRIGKVVQMRSIKIVGQLNSPTAYTSDFVRMLIIMDRSADGSAPTTADLLEYSGTPTYSTINPDYRKKFRILADMKISCAPSTTASINILPINVVKTFRATTQYSGTGASITDIINNSVYFVIFGTFSSGTSNVAKALFNGYTRVYYYDM